MYTARLIAGLIMVAGVALGQTAGAQVIYVDADANGGNDGSSWLDAFGCLQDALAGAVTGDEIVVAGGVYRPDRDVAHPQGSGDRSAAFQLKDGVAVLGGYAGFDEPEPDVRDIDLYETVLSGDLNADDGPGFSGNEENSYHVVNASGTSGAVLDGFTICGGNAHGSDPHDDGAGVVNYFGSPTVINCSFRDNDASRYGGGMFNYMFSNAVVINCKFTSNRAEYGGGMENRYYSEAFLVNCLFAGNTAGFGGGGVGNSGADASFINCVFADNYADRRGGGIYSRFDCDCWMTNTILWGNTAPEGQEMSLFYGCAAEISYCDLQGGAGLVHLVESSIDWGQGNIDSDPCFVERGLWDANGFWFEGDYHLAGGSRCTDAGSNDELCADEYDLDGDADTAEPIPLDLDRNARLVDGDNDGNDVVDMGAYEFFWPPLEVRMKFTPQALNLDSKGDWVKAHIVLPEGFIVEDVDADSPIKIVEPVEVEAQQVDVFINGDGLVEIEAAFSRGALCSSGSHDGTVKVEGRLMSGQSFVGTDKIKVIDKTLEQLCGLASYWLESNCSGPDWCGGFDADRSGTVDFADFVLLDGCCFQFGGE